MGIIICESHGRQAIMLVCPHLQRAVHERQIIGGWAKVGVTLDGELGFHCRYCFDFADQFKLPRVGYTVEMPEDEEGAGWVFGEEMPVCETCFHEAAEKVTGSS